jgi:hypothetical protein
MRHSIAAFLALTVAGCSDAGSSADIPAAKANPNDLDLLAYTIGEKAIDQPFEMFLALEEYLDAKASNRSSIKSVVSIGSGTCDQLGRTRVAKLGDITTFLEDCGKIASTTEHRWMPVSVGISGEIDATTVDALKYLYAAVARGDFGAPNDWTFVNDTYQLYLASGGGDVDAALSVGEYIWRMFDNVYATKPGCFSACVFLLAAGQDRAVFAFDPLDGNAERGIEDFRADTSGVVGVHSPIPDGVSNVTQSDLVEIRARVATKSREHFQRYGVKESLVDLMMATPSGELRYLTERELSDYGLAGESVVKVDLERLDTIKACGAEFEQNLQRWKREVEDVCPRKFVRNGTEVTVLPSTLQDDECVDRFSAQLGVTKDHCKEHGVPSFVEMNAGLRKADK